MMRSSSFSGSNLEQSRKARICENLHQAWLKGKPPAILKKGEIEGCEWARKTLATNVPGRRVNFRRRATRGGRRKTRKKRGGAPFGDFIVGDIVQLTPAGIEFYRALIRARMFHNDADRPPFKSAQASDPSTWRGEILESRRDGKYYPGTDLHPAGHFGIVSVQWPADTELYAHGIVVYEEFSTEAWHPVIRWMGPPIDYIMVVPRKDPPKSAMKVHRPRKSEEKRHPPPTDDGGGGNTYDTMGLGRLFSSQNNSQKKRPKSAMKTGKTSRKKPPKSAMKTGKRSPPTDDGGGGNTYDTMGLGRLFSQAGGKRRKTRKMRGGGTTQSRSAWSPWKARPDGGWKPSDFHIGEEMAFLRELGSICGPVKKTFNAHGVLWVKITNVHDGDETDIDTSQLYSVARREKRRVARREKRPKSARKVHCPGKSEKKVAGLDPNLPLGHAILGGRKRRKTRKKHRKKRGGAPFGDFIVGDTVQLTPDGIEFYQARKDAGGPPFNFLLPFGQDAAAPSTWRGEIRTSTAGHHLRRGRRLWPGLVGVQWPANTRLSGLPAGFVVYKEMAPMHTVYSPPISYIRPTGRVQKKRPKSAMKVSKKKGHPPPTDDGGGGNVAGLDPNLPLGHAILGGRKRRKTRKKRGGMRDPPDIRHSNGFPRNLPDNLETHLNRRPEERQDGRNIAWLYMNLHNIREWLKELKEECCPEGGGGNPSGTPNVNRALGIIRERLDDIEENAETHSESDDRVFSEQHGRIGNLETQLRSLRRQVNILSRGEGRIAVPHGGGRRRSRKRRGGNPLCYGNQTRSMKNEADIKILRARLNLMQKGGRRTRKKRGGAWPHGSPDDPSSYRPAPIERLWAPPYIQPEFAEWMRDYLNRARQSGIPSSGVAFALANKNRTKINEMIQNINDCHPGGCPGAAAALPIAGVLPVADRIPQPPAAGNGPQSDLLISGGRRTRKKRGNRRKRGAGNIIPKFVMLGNKQSEQSEQSDQSEQSEQSDQSEQSEQSNDPYTIIQMKSEDRVKCINKFLSAANSPKTKMELIRDRQGSAAAIDFMVKWCNENLSGGRRKTRKKRGGVKTYSKDFNKDDFEVGQKIDIRRKQSNYVKEFDWWENLTVVRVGNSKLYWAVFAWDPLASTVSAQQCRTCYRPEMGDLHERVFQTDYNSIQSVRYHEMPARKTGKHSTDDGGGGNTYDTMGLGRLFSQAGGKRRRTRKKRGKGPQQRAVAGKFVGNILNKYKPKAKRKKPHTAKKADRMPAPGPPNKGDIVLANVNFGDGEGPQDKEGKFLGMTRYGGNFRVEFESPKQWIATEIRVVDEIKFNGEWWSLQGAPQFGGSRTRKKRGKGPQQRAVAGKFVGNILSKYKPEAKPKARRKKTHTAKKADRAPRRPVAGDIVEVQDSFLSLSPTIQQVSDEYYGGDHGPKWYLAKLTGIARSRPPGPVRIRAPAGAHYQGIAEAYLTSNDHYRIQLLNAAGEDAGQGTQYVSSIRFPPGDGGKKYTWRPARRAVVARH